ncbi:MAG TPA: hypothetical protein VF070_14480 [Streptosporangiaceae bacterium]
MTAVGGGPVCCPADVRLSGQARRTERDSRPFIRLTGRQRSASGGTAGESPGAGQQGAEGDLGLHAGRGSAQAVVNAVAEGDVATSVAAEVEAVRVGELGGIPVGGTGRGENPLARREQRRVLPQPDLLLGVHQQRQGAGGDQVDGGVETRHDQQEGRGKELVAGQPVGGAVGA